jgi:hypothetical protein
MHILRSLGIVGIDQRITADQMKTYEGMFSTPIPLGVLKAMAALVGREMPSSVGSSPAAAESVGRQARS